VRRNEESPIEGYANPRNPLIDTSVYRGTLVTAIGDLSFFRVGESHIDELSFRPEQGVPVHPPDFVPQRTRGALSLRGSTGGEAAVRTLSVGYQAPTDLSNFTLGSNPSRPSRFNRYGYWYRLVG
jgi:hypothetical protein